MKKKKSFRIFWTFVGTLGFLVGQVAFADDCDSLRDQNVPGTQNNQNYSLCMGVKAAEYNFDCSVLRENLPTQNDALAFLACQIVKDLIQGGICSANLPPVARLFCTDVYIGLRTRSLDLQKFDPRQLALGGQSLEQEVPISTRTQWIRLGESLRREHLFLRKRRDALLSETSEFLLKKLGKRVEILDHKIASKRDRIFKLAYFRIAGLYRRENPQTQVESEAWYAELTDLVSLLEKVKGDLIKKSQEENATLYYPEWYDFRVSIKVPYPIHVTPAGQIIVHLGWKDGRHRRMVPRLGEGSYKAFHIALNYELEELKAVGTLANSHPFSWNYEKLTRAFQAEAANQQLFQGNSEISQMESFTIGVQIDEPDSRIPMMVLEDYPIELSNLDQLASISGVPRSNYVVDLAIQLLEGFEKINKRGKHRDIKKTNVLAYISTDGKPRLSVIDFGYFLTHQKIRSCFKGIDVTAGSLLFMSPEAVRCSNSTLEKNDEWAAGLLLYQLYVGDTIDTNLQTEEQLSFVYSGIVCKPEDLGRYFYFENSRRKVFDGYFPGREPFLDIVYGLLKISPDQRSSFSQALAEMRAYRAALNEKVPISGFVFSLTSPLVVPDSLSHDPFSSAEFHKDFGPALHKAYEDEKKRMSLYFDLKGL